MGTQLGLRHLTWWHVITMVVVLVLAGALLPVGVMAATGSFVNVRDYSNTGTSGQARVVNNKLGTETCDVGTTALSTSTCARVLSGRLQVGGSVAVSSLPAGTVQIKPSTLFTKACSASHGSGTALTCDVVVPAGKTLVIESVSLEADMTSSASVEHARLDLHQAAQAEHAYLPLSLSVLGGANYYVAHQQTRLYADGGSTVTFELTLSTSAIAEMDGLVSGYLV